MQVYTYRKAMDATQRKALLGVASGYQTVCQEAIQVATGIVPIHLLVENKFSKNSKRDKRKEEEGRKRQITRREMEN